MAGPLLTTSYKVDHAKTNVIRCILKNHRAKNDQMQPHLIRRLRVARLSTDNFLSNYLLNEYVESILCKETPFDF